MHARRTFISFFGLGSHTAAPLLYSYVAEHPGVCVPKEETHFFTEAKVFARGSKWYEQQFTNEKPGLSYGELAGGYLANSQAAGLIARTYPNARLFAVIENPLVSVRVEYIEALRNRLITRQTSLAEFLKQNPEVLLRARYGRQLVHYFSYYAPVDLLVSLASDVRADALKAVKATYEHLGLDSKFVPLSLRHLVVEEEDEKKKPGFIKRKIILIRALVKKVYQKLSVLIRPPEVKTETAAQLALKVPLPADLETSLKAYFRADVSQLSSLLHRNLLVEWGFDEPVD